MLDAFDFDFVAEGSGFLDDFIPSAKEIPGRVNSATARCAPTDFDFPVLEQQIKLLAQRGFAHRVFHALVASRDIFLKLSVHLSKAAEAALQKTLLRS